MLTDEELIANFRRLEAQEDSVYGLMRKWIAVGASPELAARRADSYLRTGLLPCMAKTRKGTPCMAQGTGAGGRCRLHGGESTGPRTDRGRERAAAALRRYWGRGEFARGIDKP